MRENPLARCANNPELFVTLPVARYDHRRTSMLMLLQNGSGKRNARGATRSENGGKRDPETLMSTAPIERGSASSLATSIAQ